MFYIIKRTGGFWHKFNNDSKEVNLSDFEVVLDAVANTFIIQAKNGSNVPIQAVSVNDITIIDETDASTPETYATVQLLKNRLVQLDYTAYIPAGGTPPTTPNLQTVTTQGAVTTVGLRTEKAGDGRMVSETKSDNDGGYIFTKYIDYVQGIRAKIGMYFYSEVTTKLLTIGIDYSKLTSDFALLFPVKSGTLSTLEDFITTQSIGDANATISATTTRGITTTTLTADRTWTLPSSGVMAGKSFTAHDAKQTVFANGFKVIIKVGTGKTLNGVTNGEVWLGYPGQALTFYCDGSGNYTYETPEKICVLEADSLELTTDFDGFIGLKIVKNTTTTAFDLATDFVFNSGTTGEFKSPLFDFDKHDINAYFFNNKSSRDIVAGDDTDAFADPDSKFAVVEFGAATNYDHNYKIRIYVRER